MASINYYCINFPLSTILEAAIWGGSLLPYEQMAPLFQE